MHLIFRIDDIYLDNNNFEVDIFNLFEKHNIPLNIGIIPFDKYNNPYCISEKKIPQIIEPCLHGFNHSRGGEKGEFDGLTLKEQSRLIKLGKTHLERILKKDITCFIPPWNMYNNETLEAISENGLLCLSGGMKKNYNKKNEIPCGVEHFYLINKPWFRFMLLLLPKDFKLVILFHNFNFQEFTTSHFTNKRYEFNLKKLEKLLINLKKDNHKFSYLSEIRVKESKYNFISNVIKRLTGDRVRFWI